MKIKKLSKILIAIAVFSITIYSNVMAGKVDPLLIALRAQQLDSTGSLNNLKGKTETSVHQRLIGYHRL